MSPLFGALLALALARPSPAADAEAALRESALRLAAGDVAQARGHAEAAARSDPRSARAWQQLAAAALAGQDHVAARDAAERALALSGETPALLLLRAEARGGLGDLPGALEDASRAVRVGPTSARARLVRARVLEAMGRPAEALADFERAGVMDALLADEARQARERLAPPPPRGPAGVGGLFAVLGVSAAAGWAWARLSRRSSPAPRAPSPPARSPLGERPLSPREALSALSRAAGEGGPEEAYELAVALRARLAGSDSLLGAETFFARALNPDPKARFRSTAELRNAFRDLVEPPVL